MKLLIERTYFILHFYLTFINVATLEMRDEKQPLRIALWSQDNIILA
jgi:hypothetical protein